jgi:hypothetical protein
MSETRSLVSTTRAIQRTAEVLPRAAVWVGPSPFPSIASKAGVLESAGCAA